MAAGNSRRDLLCQIGATVFAAGAGAITSSPARATETGASTNDPFGYCLNTSTIRGANLNIVEEVEIAAKTGYGRLSRGSAK